AAEFLGGEAARRAGRADQHRNRPVGLLDTLDQGEHRGLVTDVGDLGRHVEIVTPHLANRIVERAAGSGRTDHAGARLREGPRASQADALAGAGDQGHRAVEFEIHGKSPWVPLVAPGASLRRTRAIWLRRAYSSSACDKGTAMRSTRASSSSSRSTRWAVLPGRASPVASSPTSATSSRSCAYQR